MKHHPVVIIGAGVIGLSIAWHLRRKNTEVYLFDKGLVGHEASAAAAGMITPASEIRYGEHHLLNLFLESLKIYPSFVQEIEKASGIFVDFQKNGSLLVAIDQDDEAELTRFHDYQKELGLNVTMLTPSQILEKEPRLSSHCQLGVEAHDECFVDNRLLVATLKQAVIRSGGHVIENREVTALDVQQNRVIGIQTGHEKISSDQVILATGIHTKLDGLPDHLHLPIRPIKGQALEIKPYQKKESQILSHAVRTIHRYPVYLVPRSDGRIIVGATNEEMGIDNKVTAGAILDLLYGAWKILPAIEEMEFLKTWVGHRAASRDHLPIVGPSDMEGLSFAMGMYRHGILLTPIVGKMMAEWVVEGMDSAYFKTFGWERFKKR